jgi:hypothetical protein
MCTIQWASRKDNQQRIDRNAWRCGDIMIRTLSQIVDEIQASAVPLWLYQYVRCHRDMIAANLRDWGSHQIHGPNGECITIRLRATGDTIHELSAESLGAEHSIMDLCDLASAFTEPAQVMAKSVLLIGANDPRVHALITPRPEYSGAGYRRYRDDA